MALINCEECGKEFSNKASACPYCACPVTIVDSHSQATLSCPFCASENVSSLAVIHNSGKGTNVGVGLTNVLNTTAHVAHTGTAVISNNYQSALSKSAAPPLEPTRRNPALGCVGFLVLTIVGMVFFLVPGLITIIAGVVYLIDAVKYNNNEYPSLHANPTFALRPFYSHKSLILNKTIG